LDKDAEIKRLEKKVSELENVNNALIKKVTVHGGIRTIKRMILTNKC